MDARRLGVGDVAPSFRLPSAQGSMVELASYRGRATVMVWFSKGFGCPFCRQQMARLPRDYPKFRALKGELLEVTRTPLTRAQLYAQRFPLAFPYLCDPGNEARHAYGLGVRPYALPSYFGKMLQAVWRPKSFPPRRLRSEQPLGHPARHPAFGA